MRPKPKQKKEKSNEHKKKMVDTGHGKESETSKELDDASVLEFREKRKSIG